MTDVNHTCPHCGKKGQAEYLFSVGKKHYFKCGCGKVFQEWGL